MKRRTYIILFTITTILSTLMIFGFSSQDGANSSEVSGSLLDLILNLGLPITEHVLRKTAHVTIYFILGINSTALAMSILFPREKWRYQAAIGMGIAYSFLCACLDEWNQYHTPGRDGQFSDVGFDAIGFVIGSLLIVVLVKWYIQYRSNRLITK